MLSAERERKIQVLEESYLALVSTQSVIESAAVELSDEEDEAAAAAAIAAASQFGCCCNVHAIFSAAAEFKMILWQREREL